MFFVKTPEAIYCVEARLVNSATDFFLSYHLVAFWKTKVPEICYSCEKRSMVTNFHIKEIVKQQLLIFI